LCHSNTAHDSNANNCAAQCCTKHQAMQQASTRQHHGAKPPVTPRLSLAAATNGVCCYGAQVGLQG